MEKHTKISENELDQLIDKALIEEPEFELPLGIAEQVSSKLARQNQLLQYLQEFGMYLGLFLLIVALAFGSLFWSDQSIIAKAQQYISNQYPLVIGINLLLIFILFTDRVLLRYFQFVSRKKMMT